MKGKELRQMTICRVGAILGIFGFLLCGAPVALRAQTEGPLKIKRPPPPPPSRPPAPTSDNGASAPAARERGPQKTYSGSARESGMGSPVGGSGNGEDRPLFRRPDASAATPPSDDGRPKLKRSSPPKSGTDEKPKESTAESTPASSASGTAEAPRAPAVEVPVKEDSAPSDRPTLKRGPQQKPVEKQPQGQGQPF